MNIKDKNALEQLACKIRIGILEGVYAAKSGHPGGSLSCADLMTCLYEKVMKHDSKNPSMEDRDRFVLSKGHAAPVLYSTLAAQGYFDESELKKLRSIGSFLQGHPDMKKTPGVDMTTGSLGQGISAACGMALAGKIQNKKYRVYALLGDGECEEGQVWEAAMFAAKEKLDNLCIVVDYNGLQIDGPISEVGGPEPIDAKFEAFGWHTVLTSAHNFEEILGAFSEAMETKNKPTCIIAKSIKGKGVSFMENQASWHGSAPNEKQFLLAMGEMQSLMLNLKEDAKYD